MAGIVFCEDDELVRKLIRVAFRDSGHTLFMARDGAEGLALIRHECPALVVTDLMMPGLSGLDLCMDLKASATTRHIPIVVLTAAVQRHLTEASLRAGAEAVLSKPFTTHDLRQTVARIIG
jgi:CheY-like chemotaxis protein